MNSKSLAMNMIVARSQGASLRPAVVGTMMKRPMFGMLLTLLLSKREVESAPVVPAKLVRVPNLINHPAEDAKSDLEDLGFKVATTRLWEKDGPGPLDDYIVFDQEPFE